MDLTYFINFAVSGLEVLGVAAVVGGIIWATWRLIRRGHKQTNLDIYEDFRRLVGRGILLGLELFVAADIIRTVAVKPSFQSVGTLAAIVLIRTFLSFTLEVEMTGRWPWQRKV